VTRLLRIGELAGRAREAAPRAGATRVVALDGPSGSGKSTLARRLSDALGGAPVVHMDDLFPGWDGLADAAPRLLEWVLEPLARGERARYRRYDWTAGAYAEWHDLPDVPVLVVEGCGCGVRATAPYLSLLVWVQAPHGERMRRGMERDGEAYRPHWERWARQEQALYDAERVRERADLRVDGHPDADYDPETEVVLLD
jgi:uridine kinase